MLSSSALGALANATERGLLAPPYGEMQVGRHVAKGEQAEALRLLERLHSAGISGSQLATTLRVVEAARRAGEARPEPTLVWSDLDIQGSRDTSIVCNELFRGASRSVLLSTFNLGHKAKDGEEKGNPVLLPLAKRMAEVENLQVRLFVNLRRMQYMAHATDREIEEAFAGWFRKEIWPWERMPDVYYDPRSLEGNSDEIACLHAKCVVVDDLHAFVTSANLTEAAQGRNIEAGVLLEDPVFARRLRLQFESLVDRGYVRRLTMGLGG